MPRISKPPADAVRHPRSDIPASLMCPLCAAQGLNRSFKNEFAYRGHMHSKHSVLYELTEVTKSGASVDELRQYTDVSELTKLKPYMALAIARHEVYGETWE